MKSKVGRKNLIMPYPVREVIKKMMWPLARQGDKEAQQAIKYCWLHRDAQFAEGYSDEDEGLTKKQMFENWEKDFIDYPKNLKTGTGT